MIIWRSRRNPHDDELVVGLLTGWLTNVGGGAAIKSPLRSTSVVPSSRRIISRGVCLPNPDEACPLDPEGVAVVERSSAVARVGGGGPPGILRMWLSKVISV